MKRLLFVLSLALLFNGSLLAQQTPLAFNYSGIARDASGNALASTSIGLQMRIFKGSANGTIEYIENHTVNTDAFGLFNLVVGFGQVQSGSLAAVNWGNDNYFLSVGMDISGGTNYLEMGTTQLLSVPYALHAKTAETVLNSGSGTANFSHEIGELFGGGVIFELWKDAQGIEHGLIVDLTDLSNGHPWSNMTNSFIGSSAQSNWDGYSNSLAIVAQQGHTSSAAALCLNSNSGGLNDWYLPSVQEMNILWKNYYRVSRTLEQTSGAQALKYGDYWCSNESDSWIAWTFYFGEGTAGTYDTKDVLRFVRAIRAF